MPDRLTDKACGHVGCQLATRTACCVCLDTRPHSGGSEYRHYVDGQGWVLGAPRSKYYCQHCQAGPPLAADPGGGAFAGLARAHIAPGASHASPSPPPHSLLAPGDPARTSAKACGHTQCHLSGPRCCACADRRPARPFYARYVDGRGVVDSAHRAHMYCTPCRALAQPPPAPRAQAAAAPLTQRQARRRLFLADRMRSAFGTMEEIAADEDYVSPLAALYSPALRQADEDGVPLPSPEVPASAEAPAHSATHQSNTQVAERSSQSGGGGAEGAAPARTFHSYASIWGSTAQANSWADPRYRRRTLRSPSPEPIDLRFHYRRRTLRAPSPEAIDPRLHYRRRTIRAPSPEPPSDDDDDDAHAPPPAAAAPDLEPPPSAAAAPPSPAPAPPPDPQPCSICLAAPRRALLLPCAHLVACAACVRRLVPAPGAAIGGAGLLAQAAGADARAGGEFELRRGELDRVGPVLQPGGRAGAGEGRPACPVCRQEVKRWMRVYMS